MRTDGAGALTRARDEVARCALMPPPVPYRTVTLHGIRAGSTRTTSHTLPSISSTRMMPADGSICQRLSPCRYEVGNAWWLLCQASPQVGIASHARLRDSSPVSYSWRPKKWHSELMLNVA